MVKNDVLAIFVSLDGVRLEKSGFCFVFQYFVVFVYSKTVHLALPEMRMLKLSPAPIWNRVEHPPHHQWRSRGRVFTLKLHN